MKLLTLSIALLVWSAAFAQNRPTPFPQSVLTTTADHIVLDGPVTELNGNVEIKSADFVIQADQAIHHGGTREIEAHGNVLLKSAKGDVKANDLRVLQMSGEIRVLVTGIRNR